ncbi:universal stress protein [Mucilaginibacter aquariorum]|uniref:Universal stress protein n=1 Tax=Mucilaginibacter aquariorum TaxID=2967225 RepID=A0ABT1T3T5_9SPHI|nr:universal stress protein [Mucilaginibacter aquariorum]MCQ6959182.1 universal stress protein [Mucilaginibacter aquariorum]
MEKILVTTDLSLNSKSGIRFAMRLAEQRNAELIVLHVFAVSRSASWTSGKYKEHIAQQKEEQAKRLAAFTRHIERTSKIFKLRYRILAEHGMDTVACILRCTRRYRATFICISTHGARAIKKMFGTHTSELILQSAIPVITVPSNWRQKAFSKILYATDMTDYHRELKKVVAFARPVKATVTMLHLLYKDQPIPDDDMAEKTLAKEAHYPVKLMYRKMNIENTIIEEIDDVIAVIKPSILVLFTHQDRSAFDRMLFPGIAEEYCFCGNIPLLTFKKSRR